MLKDFISLIFPSTCAACGNSLYKNEKSICTYCVYHLPKTNFHLLTNNTLSKLFWGRVEMVNASAYYSFGKGGKVQNLIHQLKYKGNREAGFEIGKLYGQELIMTDKFNLIDVIIPVPLHVRKLKKRGYNQSVSFAEGLSAKMKIQTNTTILKRVIDSETQTKKGKYNRWENVNAIFEINDNNSLKGKHILLVDDVITTGATIEACAQTLLQIPDVKISVVAIAFADN